MTSISGRDRLGPRGSTVVGLAGAVLAGVGDVLILGRPVSGAEFDRAAGVLVPPHVGLAPTWRSMWNGTVHSPSRIRLGTATGLVGIGLVERFGLAASARAGRGGTGGVAGASAAVFAVAGALTHLSCGALILACQRALAAPVTSDTSGESAAVLRPVSRGWSTALGGSAAATLGALAVFSADATVRSLRSPGTGPTWAAFVTPFPFVAATLLTFGALPAPLGGYVRPASISTGLLLYLAVEAVAPAPTRSDRSAP